MNYTKSDVNALSYEIIGAAIEVHKQLGPGLLESIYHQCLEIELLDRGFEVRSEARIPVIYKNRQLETTLRTDLIIDGLIVVEVKAAKELHPVFEAQLLTYMKLLKVPKGIMFNFFCTNLFHHGQKTYVNELFHEMELE